jgi:hypothetical protein
MTKKLREFKNEDEEREFWAAADSTKYLDWSSRKRNSVQPKPSLARTEVFRWRVSVELKSRLECEARRRKISMSAALDLAARGWLKIGRDQRGEEQQRQIHEAAAKYIGAFVGGDPQRSENARPQRS